MKAIETTHKRNDIFPSGWDKFIKEKTLVARVRNTQINKNGNIIMPELTEPFDFI